MIEFLANSIIQGTPINGKAFNYTSAIEFIQNQLSKDKKDYKNKVTQLDNILISRGYIDLIKK